LGDEHPDTLLSMISLAAHYSRTDKETTAEQLYREAVLRQVNWGWPRSALRRPVTIWRTPSSTT
jgi:hypothetical protein